MTERQVILDVGSISFDTDNPRIKMALEKYGDQTTADRIHFALKSAAGGTNGTSSYTRLRDSIRANGGVVFPIVVITRGDGYVCIDGNTRLAIYKQFLREHTQGQWSVIKAIILTDAGQRDVETIRVSAHLVGSREWPPYEKARYLHYLRNEELMGYNEMIELCGGNKPDLERQIDAYHDMNEYYRDVVDDTAFQIDRFSGFVELQKPKVKQAVFDAGLKLEDFGEWVRDGMIYRLEDVRQLPKVLHDDEAREIFLEGGPRSIERAYKYLEHKIDIQRGPGAKKISLDTATIYQLADALVHRINELPYTELRALKNREHGDSEEQISTLEDLSTRLKNLLEDVSE